MSTENRSQLPCPAEPDMALLFLGSWFVTLHHAAERDDAMLDALATQIILDRGPKTLLGLAVTACAEKWLRRRLWMVDFESLPPSDQAVRLVTDSAMRIDCTHWEGQYCPPTRH
jgi:hypothetical protein